jgi:hypothetical protein
MIIGTLPCPYCDSNDGIPVMRFSGMIDVECEKNFGKPLSERSLKNVEIKPSSFAQDK